MTEMKPSQLQLFAKPSPEHGGSLRAGKRKIARPFTSKKPLHLVFKSTKAKGQWSFLAPRNKGVIHLLLDAAQKKWNGKIHRFENVGNHLHIIAQFKKRSDFQSFLREFTQKVMFQVTGAKKGNPQGKFFASIAYSRVIEWGKSYRAAKNYLWKNALESLGFSNNLVQKLYSTAKLVPA